MNIFLDETTSNRDWGVKIGVSFATIYPGAAMIAIPIGFVP